MSITADLLQKGKALYFDLTDATSTWDSTTDHKEPVPAGKIWYLLYGIVNRNVSSTMKMNIVDASDNYMARMDSEGAASGINTFPDNQAGKATLGASPLIRLDAGEKLHFEFGTAQDATSYIRFKVIEVEA